MRITDDVAGTIARDEAARRAVRRRHGRARQELPQGRDGAPRLRRRGRRASRSCSSPAGATKRSPRCPTSTSTRARCSARRARIAERFRPWTECGAHRPDDPHRPGRGGRADGRARRQERRDDATSSSRSTTPRRSVRRITLNRPEKRNAINNGMRAELFDALEAADTDAARARHDRARRGPVLLVGLRPEARRAEDAAVLHRRRRRELVAPRHRRLVPHLGSRQAGDRAGARLRDGGRHRARRRVRPRVRRARRDVQLSRRARDQPARLPVPPVARRHAQRDGAGAHRRPDHRRRRGAHGPREPRVPADELDAQVLAIAERIAGVPAELLQINKRSVHRAMEIMGIRTGLRAGSELQALASQLPAVRRCSRATRSRA